MAKGPESKVKDKIVAILKFHNAWYCFPATHGMGRSGVPDVLICHRGMSIAVEVKATVNNKPTKLQEHELWKHQEAGGWSCVIHKDNLLDLEGLLSSITAMAEITRLQGHDKLEDQEARAAARAVAQETFVDAKVEDGTIEDTRPESKRHKSKDTDAIN